ncbi:hypothetical protein CRG98_027811 [Punica granatum]|uniref:Uncharacterized protein n=1 Tax=Punica granatum TaxID=22663 RepID=A0A2I0J6V8_PUNGR|nr:hypothetical protein CRG98_027811 [Punica granatum]
MAIDGLDPPYAARGLKWPQPHRRDWGCDHKSKVEAPSHDWVLSRLLSLHPNQNTGRKHAHHGFRAGVSRWRPPSAAQRLAAAT